MKIQIFSKYYKLAQAGKVKPLACPNHKRDEELFAAVYWLVHKQQDDKIVLYCTACGYEQTAGLQLYENIVKEIVNASNR
jgi:hypothetical protein